VVLYFLAIFPILLSWFCFLVYFFYWTFIILIGNKRFFYLELDFFRWVDFALFCIFV